MVRAPLVPRYEFLMADVLVSLIARSGTLTTLLARSVPGVSPSGSFRFDHTDLLYGEFGITQVRSNWVIRSLGSSTLVSPNCGRGASTSGSTSFPKKKRGSKMGDLPFKVPAGKTCHCSEKPDMQGKGMRRAIGTTPQLTS